MSLTAFNRMRRIEAMKPENIIKAEEEKAEILNKVEEEPVIDEPAVEEVVEIEPVEVETVEAVEEEEPKAEEEVKPAQGTRRRTSKN